MSNFTMESLNVGADAIAGEITQCSLHSDDPGDTGDNELSGGSYSRESVTFDAASGGEAAVNNSPLFNVPASATVAYVGFWAGTDFRVGVQVPTETYSSNGGTYQVQNTTKLALQNQS